MQTILKRSASTLFAALTLLALPAIPHSTGNAAAESAADAEDSDVPAVTTAVTETTAAVQTTETAAVTTETLPAAAPHFTLSIEPSYPLGQAELHLILENNSGLEALGAVITLPDILTPETGSDFSTVFHPTAALSDENIYAFYQSETNAIALTYAASEAGAATDDLGYFTLDVAGDAVIGSSYAIGLQIDTIFCTQTADAVTTEEFTYFIPREPLSLTLSETELTLTEQDTPYQLTLSPEPPANSCVWRTGNPGIVTVDENGVLTALRCGQTVITVECELRQYTCAVTVALERQLSPQIVTVPVQGETVQLSLIPKPHSPVTSWQSSDESVLSIDETGLATVHANGTVTVEAVCEAVHYSFEVTAEIPRTLNYSTYTFTDSEQTAALMLEPMPDTPVVWSIDNPTVAEVDADGLVIPVGNGTAVVTAYCEGISYACEITVNLPLHLNITEYTAKPQDTPLALALLPAPAEGTVTWTSSDPTVAAVDENGLVSFLAEGEAEITAEYDGETFLCVIHVSQYLRGDIDDDGEITGADAQQALSAYTAVYLTGRDSPLTPIQQLAADVNEDGKVNISDAFAILTYYTMQMLGYHPTWEQILSEMM